MRKSEEELKAKVRERKLNVPLGSQRWTPLLKPVILELESSNPSAGGGGAGVFLNEKGGREVL